MQQKQLLYQIVSLCLFILATNAAKAQFVSQGTITYERKTSLRMQMQAEMTESNNSWLKDYIDKVAQYTISDFSLKFNKQASSFSFDKEQEVKGMTFSWGGRPGRENNVYTQYDQKTVLAQKQVFENNYLEKRSLPNYEWKIMDEMRIIAGYPCRKAITKICDSVVVVAFYTDQIMVSGGPESFNGLPGMILGLAIPRLYTTWFAAKVEESTPEVIPFKPAKKSKEVNSEDMLAEVKKGTKDWNEHSNILLWWLSL